MNSDYLGDLFPEGSTPDEQDQEIVIHVDDPHFPIAVGAPLTIDFDLLLSDDDDE